MNLQPVTANISYLAVNMLLEMFRLHAVCRKGRMICFECVERMSKTSDVVAIKVVE